ncbi:MAG TPA: SHOCT domain-containing protein [Paenirhodobacter sp.]
MLLTDEGQKRVAQIGQQHGFSLDAAEVMMAALVAGNGTQAQFSHPEFGGMGQWSVGGMLMIGDMFNNGLKFRVDGLAQDLAGLVGTPGLFPPYKAEAGGFTASSLWPEELGAPSASGSQNDMRYAVFPAQRRLAVVRDGQMFLYDTGDNVIGGVSQQQGGGNGLQFNSQYGPMPLDSLTPITLGGAPPVAVAVSAPERKVEPAVHPAVQNDDGTIFSKIEQLHGLFSRGILTQTEFETKKAELLSRL